MNADTATWTAANQRYLMARLATVRAALSRHIAGPDSAPAQSPAELDGEQACRELADAMPAPAALDSLCAAFDLSPFERDLLLLCAGVELDSAIAAICAAQGGGRRGAPTFSMALGALTEPHWSAITPAGALRRWRMIEVGAGDALTTSPLRIDERVLHYLCGITYLDDRLQGLLDPQQAPKALSPSHGVMADRAAALWARPEPEGRAVIHLGGDSVSGKRAFAAFVCARLALRLYVLDAANIPASAAEREALARLWEREATLQHGALLLDCEEVDTTHAAVSFLRQVRGYCLIAGRLPLQLCDRPVARLEIDKPDAAEQTRLWRLALGPLAARLNGKLENLIAQFDLGAEEIASTGAQIVANSGNGEDGLEQLWTVCRIKARGRVDGLAQRIEPAAAWSDLVLPAAQLQMLHDIAAQVRHRYRVHETWGFAAKGKRGLGTSVLFSGASGTGKTMAAEILAGQLGLDLYRVDLSQVVNKYIGETEKNLRRIFDAAEASGAVLLFDEADALFGKRSDVKDSHDRYANIEVSYLLQRVESYGGLAILTTNMKTALDKAFLRRIRFVVEFPFPDSAQRAEIWRRIFPARTPVDGLDVAKLARLNVAGGNIRNIALQAAFLAAEADNPVSMAHLLRAARGEYGKLEKHLTDAECRDWL